MVSERLSETWDRWIMKLENGGRKMMKKMIMKKKTFGLILLLIFSFCVSSWAANFSFTDPAGQWWSGTDFSITIDWSDGLAVTAVRGTLFQGSGDVGVSVNTDGLFVKSYSLDARSISNATGYNGPVISVNDIFPFTNPLTKVVANNSDDFFVAWNLTSKTIMLYDGNPLGNCYTYLGLDFSDDLAYSPASKTSMTFTASNVEAIAGQRRCSSVPIPGAIWLLSSGLFGLVCIRRRKKS